MKLGLFYSHPRFEEKAFFAAAKEAKVKIVRIRAKELKLNLKQKDPILASCEAVLLRALSHFQNFYLANYCQRFVIPTVNPLAVLRVCGDKLLTSLALTQAGIPTLQTYACYSVESAFEVAEAIGYPIVLKPLVGSWGRLLACLNDRKALEAVLEHKQVLGGSAHGSIFYLQEYLPKKTERDIRVLTCGSEILGAIYRHSKHWITNTACGGETAKCPLTPEIKKLVQKTLAAISGSELALLGIDLVETPDGLKVLEVNAGVEFHGFAEVGRTDLATKILQKIKENN